MKQIRVTKSINHNYIRHFTRCNTFLSSNVEGRGHLYAPRLDHPFHVQQLKVGRIHHECIFCGEPWTQTNFNPRPHDGVIVKDVPNNELVRKEAETRNIAIKHYKISQESPIETLI